MYPLVHNACSSIDLSQKGRISDRKNSASICDCPRLNVDRDRGRLGGTGPVVDPRQIRIVSMFYASVLRGLQERFVSLGFCVQEAALTGGLFTFGGSVRRRTAAILSRWAHVRKPTTRSRLINTPGQGTAAAAPSSNANGITEERGMGQHPSRRRIRPEDRWPGSGQGLGRG